jgi:hypothetical protein
MGLGKYQEQPNIDELIQAIFDSKLPEIRKHIEYEMERIIKSTIANQTNTQHPWRLPPVFNTER